LFGQKWSLSKTKILEKKNSNFGLSDDKETSKIELFFANHMTDFFKVIYVAVGCYFSFGKYDS